MSGNIGGSALAETRVDAHHHLWRIDTGLYDWINADLHPIQRDFDFEHLAPYLAHFGIGKTVLVQAADCVAENTAMLVAAAKHSTIAGIVVWVDLESPDAIGQLEDLAGHRHVKGIRPMLQGIADTEWVLRPEVITALSHLPRLGLTFDALIQPRHLPVIDMLGEQLPDLRIVIDHAAKPVIRGGQAAGGDWERGMAGLAENPNMFCKISGLATEAGPGWSADTLWPIVSHLIETFGAARLMWGSDWPVLELDGSYGQWAAVSHAMLAELSPKDQARILGGTATAFYSL